MITVALSRILVECNYAKIGAYNPTLFNQRLHNRFRRVPGDGKADAFHAAHSDLDAVDADHFAVRIGKGPAAVAGVDRRIGLNQSESALTDVERPVQGADYAGSHTAFQFQA